MPSVLSMEIPPTVTLSVVIPEPVMAVVPFVKPDVLITVLPAVTESTVRSFLVATVIFFLSVPSWVIKILSPLIRSTVSPPCTDVLSVVLEFVVIFHAAPALAASAALLIASATFLAVARPSSPVTDAAPVVALLSIVARFVDTSTVLPFILVDTKSPVAPFTLNATSPSFKDWLEGVPLSAPRETLRFTAAAESLIFALVSSLISNVTLPSLSTVALVIVPSTKSRPLDNLTVLASVSAAVLARYVKVWLATVSFNCFTFTASVSAVPSATS